ncbi:PaaI family thioesterase [Thalassomonas haliotis]|uniref:PaaI family thioesterase n=1 Tax=Thalassomonas haliotis TaxID=485448 RepID=A0ABY7VJX0_9GAMM|nr:PaaI family thioesterase [Thalassomonas haliotis]WDE13761.1 PaaI family thioesterase [Thalassomonas haliotis]
MANKAELRHFFQKEFPQADFIIDSVGEKSATIRKKINHGHLRPGGTVSGPVLMELADAALYVTILSEIGLVAHAVTTNLNINFLRKPSAEKDIIAKCTLIKLGKVLVIGEVSLYSQGLPEPVAHAVGTYSIPAVKSIEKV